jgi:hypothetical protein
MGGGSAGLKRHVSVHIRTHPNEWVLGAAERGSEATPILGGTPNGASHGFGLAEEPPTAEVTTDRTPILVGALGERLSSSPAFRDGVRSP